MACTLSERLSELYSFAGINFSRVSASLQRGTEKLCFETSSHFFFSLVPTHLQKRSTSTWLMTPVWHNLTKAIWSGPPNHIPFENSKYLSRLVGITVTLIHDKRMYDMYTLVRFAGKTKTKNDNMGGKPRQIQFFVRWKSRSNSQIYAETSNINSC